MNDAIPPQDAALRDLAARAPVDAAERLRAHPPEVRERLLAALPDDQAARIRERLDGAFNPPAARTVADLMEPPRAVMPARQTVAAAVEWLTRAADVQQITYLYCTDEAGRLVGLVVMRDLLLARPGQPLAEIMLADPFHFRPETPLGEAVRASVHRHFPVYPVCDAEGRLVGLVRGWQLFERQVVEISAQSGTLVGLDKEERLRTPVWRSLSLRHPWLQLNLLGTFGTALVVSLFDATIEQVVVLAAFLPVLSCLAGNNGCQTLAITLRGLTLGDLSPRGGGVAAVLRKELLIGVLNGAGTGFVAGLAMMLFAWLLGMQAILTLGLIMWGSMVAMCAFSSALGMLVPLALARRGTDPATASSIFVLTVTDVVGMGLMLLLATVFVL